MSAAIIRAYAHVLRNMNCWKGNTALRLKEDICMLISFEIKKSDKDIDERIVSTSGKEINVKIK